MRAILGSGTKLSYAADWSEYFGHHPQDGSGDVFFHLDPLWADDEIDFVGIDNYMPLSDWRDGLDHLDAESADAITDLDYLRGNVEGGEGFDWFYASAADREAQVRTPITDGAARPAVGVPLQGHPHAGGRTSTATGRAGSRAAATTAWVPESKPIRFTEIGCPAVDRGPNQPNVFYDPKSAESFLPYFSRGWRDDAVQRRFLEAALGYWAEPANNPMSGVYSRPDDHHRRDRGLDLGRAAVPGVPGAERRLDRRRQLAARALAERPARLGLARQPGARALPPRRAARRARSTPRRSPTSCTAT